MKLSTKEIAIYGMLGGFATWWVPYLYVWTVLWAVTMMIPQNLPNIVTPFVYMVVISSVAY